MCAVKAVTAVTGRPPSIVKRFRESSITGLRISQEGAMSEPALLYEKRGGIAYLTFNRPAVRNAMSPDRSWPRS